jgi:hypothetical protein
VKVGDLIVFAESFVGVVTEIDPRFDMLDMSQRVKVLLTEGKGEEWVDREGCRVIS